VNAVADARTGDAVEAAAVDTGDREVAMDNMEAAADMDLRRRRGDHHRDLRLGVFLKPLIQTVSVQKYSIL
jgi:hypothetical protein